MILNFDPGVLLLPGECAKKVARRLRNRQKAANARARYPELVRLRIKRWRDRNSVRFRQHANDYYRRNKKRVQALAKLRRERNPDTTSDRRRKHYRKNSVRLVEESIRRNRERRRSDWGYRTLVNIRGRLGKLVKAQGASKANKTLALLGCSLEDLKTHLTSLFQPGMDWANYGLKGWHIDHKRPCASFDLTDPEQQRACFHYTNLQPLWAKDNVRKGAKWNPELTPALTSLP